MHGRITGDQRFEFDASRSDYVVRLVRWCFPNNHLLVAVLYTVVSMGGTVLLTIMWEKVRPPSQEYVPIFKDYANIMNYGIVVPIGIVLVLNFYACVNRGIRQLVTDRIIVFEGQRQSRQFLQHIDDAVNRKWFFYVSLALAVLCYSFFAWNRKGYWNSGIGGPNVWWFRFFSAINIYMVFHLAAKSFVIVRAIRDCFKQKIMLQPLHPDGCGGLRSLGNISLAINYLVGLIAVYLSILAFLEFSPLDNPVFFIVLVTYFVIAGYLFFVPLADAHDLMEREKSEVLFVLNREFQSTYTKAVARLPAEGLTLEDAQKIESLERLHGIASRMPVWPMDTRIVGQFLGVVAVPLIVGLFIELAKTWFY